MPDQRSMPVVVAVVVPSTRPSVASISPAEKAPVASRFTIVLLVSLLVAALVSAYAVFQLALPASAILASALASV